MSIEINGKFGVEILDKDGHVVRKEEAHNTVSTAGVLQVKRWLDRNEYVSALPNYGSWKDGVYCAGEAKQITVYPSTYMTGTGTMIEDTNQSWDRMFDGSLSTYFYFYAENSVWHSIYLTFLEPINIKQIGMIHLTSPSTSWDGHTVNSIAVKVDGYTIAGAGTTAYNGVEYLREPDTYNDYMYFKKEGASYYLFVNSDKTKWILSSSLGGTAAYQTVGTALPTRPHLGTWEIGNGSMNIPTLTWDTTAWRYPAYLENNTKLQTRTWDGSYSTTDSCHFKLYTFGEDEQSYRSVTTSSDAFVGKMKYKLLSFESIKNLPSGYGFSTYGYIPWIKKIHFNFLTMTQGTAYEYIYALDIYEPIMHPQNPYALKLGTDDGSLLPLASGNTALGAFSTGMEWKCSTVTQPSGTYTVRFIKTLNPDEANNITFKEIGLFMNADGHLPTKFTEPTLANATNLFSRAIFDSPWSKTSDQTAIIYYEISVT